MYVIGTAGHVDHGKSALVQALTGIDPDRLREEKERGMTIDLGFAWLTLPDGQDVSVIDVPGHERFIKNMLAGVGGIDAGLLVIAADEGIMPQTEEHLSILELLQIPSCLIAVTKVDLVEEDWLGLVHDDITERMKRSRYAEAPMVDVSVVDNLGLDQLVAQVQAALVKSESRPDLGQPRLPIDRVFTVAGFGTVVTGTLTGGSITVGQELVVQPGGRKTRVRGMQAHKTMVLQAMPGTRVAVNVAGVAVEELKRGQVLTTAGWLAPSLAVDVWLQVIESAPGPLKHNAPVTFHVGASEVAGIVKLLDADALAARQAGWAQIKLAEPVLVAGGPNGRRWHGCRYQCPAPSPGECRYAGHFGPNAERYSRGWRYRACPPARIDRPLQPLADFISGCRGRGSGRRKPFGRGQTGVFHRPLAGRRRFSEA